jgi:flavin-dependent dehydrogenase
VSETSQQIDKPAFTRALLLQALAGGAQYLPDTRVLTMERRPGHWRVDTDRCEIRAALVGDATGRASSIARKLGAKRIALDTLTATTIALPPSGDRQQYLIEAVEGGWWYCARHPKFGRVGTYFTDNDMRIPFAEAVRRSSLTRHFLGDIPSQRPRVFSAATATLEPVSGPAWFAVGDAAWSSDPLSSSGIANAVYTAAWAIEDVRGFPERVAQAFQEYRRNYESMYATSAQRGEFWRRRTARSEMLGARGVRTAELLRAWTRDAESSPQGDACPIMEGTESGQTRFRADA